MTERGGRIATLLLPAGALAILAVAGAVVWADLGDAERAAAAALLTAPRIGLLALFAGALAGLVGLGVWRMVAPRVDAARRIAEAAKIVTHGNPAHRLQESGPPELRAVAAAVNELADARSQLVAEAATVAAEAKARVETERNRLAALVSELEQSVLVCNREGQILLYNAAAQALLGGAGAAAASELVGLGRSVFGVVERAAILHALEALERHLARGSRETARLVTATVDGRLLRVQVAPVVGTEAGAPAQLTGYVLLLEDVTSLVDADAKRATLLQGLVEGTRAALANIRAAIETLTGHPEMEPARRQRFAAIIHDEALRLSDRLDRHAGAIADGLKARWPLEETRGEDLLTLASSRIERRTPVRTRLDAVDPDLWLRVDSFSLAQVLTSLAGRLHADFDVREVRFRLGTAGAHAQLDLMWRGPPVSSETAFAWHGEPLTAGGEDSPLTLAQVIERHGGEGWYQRDVPTQTAYFRLLLPLAGVRRGIATRGALESRPEFYDFDLFRGSTASAALDDRRLADLAYTVLDTETTGLDPSGGDEIIAIGAVRIVNGRLLKGEAFESLVDPQRGLPETSIAVHGITAEALAGQPTIDQVLPRLRRFAEDTVLVGHNAAFDMRFLQLKEARAGVHFDQPVLDTLLLSAIVHPAQASHALEAIAARLGVEVVGRHTALGDALVAAEVFLRLVPLLAEKGIRTLGEARAASERTYYARLKY